MIVMGKVFGSGKNCERRGKKVGMKERQNLVKSSEAPPNSLRQIVAMVCEPRLFIVAPSSLARKCFAPCCIPEKVTEKAVRRLSELVPTYKHQLKDKEVLSNFMALAKQAKTFAGREVEQAVDEWKAQLQKVIVVV